MIPKRLPNLAAAYGALIDTPAHARKLPAIRQALRDEEKR